MKTNTPIIYPTNKQETPLSTIQQIEDFNLTDLNDELLQELAEELGLDDIDLVKEVVSEICSEIKPTDNLTKDFKIQTEYQPSDLQQVKIKYIGRGQLLYEVSEPKLNEKETDNIKLLKNIFDRFIGLGEHVITSDYYARREYLWNRLQDIIKLYNLKLTEEEKQKIFYYLERDFLKYGKIDTLMNDKYIEDISCNGPNMPLYIYHREYGSVKTNISFEEKELNEFILRLSQLCGKHISILNPIVDASLPEGSRINMTLGSEVTRKGSSFTIRKFKKIPISPVELMSYNSIDSKMLAYMWMMIEYGRSFLVSGGTASGKTTLLNALCMFIKPQYKVVSIEDTPEINLEHPNWLQSVARTGFGVKAGEGELTRTQTTTLGNIGLYDLLVAALRQRPEYIVVGEVRGSEAFTMFQAIAVGHACMGTIHARNMTELLGRVESVPMNVPRTLFSNVDLVVFISQIRSGDKTVRRVIEIVEVLELEPNTKALITNPAFRWNPKTDEFEAGRFMLFNNIAAEFGITTKTLTEEYQKRVMFLEDLKNCNVKNHKDFVNKITEYYANQIKHISYIHNGGV